MNNQALDMTEIDVTEGFQMLKKGRYVEALDYFERLLATNDPMINYGFATAKFLKDGEHSHSREELKKIIDRYEGALSQDDSFGDAHMMCGLAYASLASVLTREYKAHPYDDGDTQVTEILGALEKSKGHIERAAALRPDFADQTKNALRDHNTRVEGIRGLQEYYNNAARWN